MHETRSNGTGSPRPFRSAAVLGAGVMGSQIAAHLANAGLQVLLLDVPAKEGPKNSVVEGALKKALKMKPSPFATQRTSRRISVGNFDDDLHRIRDVEWIVEVVVENLEIKQEFLAAVEKAASPDAVITTNTSGLPIGRICQGRSADFKRRFMGTHFFNPPRYLRLFEIIPTPETDAGLLERIRHFARVHLGKGVVVAKDTPNFIGNRVGVYAMQRAMQVCAEQGFTIEEVDFLTGTLIGRPKSATFRTADVVGLDTLIHVTENLYQAVEHDESRSAFQVPDLVKRLVESGALGAKNRKGFYRKVGRDILSVNPETLEYEPARPLDLGDIGSVKKAGGVNERTRALYQLEGRAGDFFRKTTLETLAYAARRIPEISDSPADIDRAVRWGFGWELGPFQTWDLLGVSRVLNDMREAAIELPGWISPFEARDSNFYTHQENRPFVYIPPEGDDRPDQKPDDEIELAPIRSRTGNTVWKNDEAALLDLGDGVLLYEFRSKGNSLGMNVMRGLVEALEILENGDYAGMVVGNQGRNFSAGANLAEMAQIALSGDRDILERTAREFQDVLLRVRYASKPVVAAVHSQVLGGACELVMNCSQVVAPTETYIGLVEVGVGLIPAGTGTMHMTARAVERAVDELPSQVQYHLSQAFQTLGTAKVATSAQEAVELGYLQPATRIIMNSQRRFHVAKQEALRLFEGGYSPPPVRESIYVLGEPGKAVLSVTARTLLQAGYATQYDVLIAERLAGVMTGGRLSGPGLVPEDYLLELEREAILSLLGERRTQERIEHVLRTRKPLRN